VSDITQDTTALAANTDYVATYVRSGTTGTYYVNAVAGFSPPDNKNYSVGVSRIGLTDTTPARPFSGKIYWARIYSVALSAAAVAADAAGTVQASNTVDFNPARYVSGTTFTASTGEVWTRNAGAYIGNGGEAYFDGALDYMKSAPYSLSQPESVYFVGSQLSWTSGDQLYDGFAAPASQMALYQTGTTPSLSIFGGTSTAATTALVIGTRGVVSSVFNGASSSNRVNLGTAATGNSGSENGKGFTLAASPIPAGYGNITWSEALLRSAADDAALQLRIAAFEMRKWGIS
jgi:hypothetical protein